MRELAEEIVKSRGGDFEDLAAAADRGGDGAGRQQATASASGCNVRDEPLGSRHFSRSWVRTFAKRWGIHTTRRRRIGLPSDWDKTDTAQLVGRRQGSPESERQSTCQSLSSATAEGTLQIDRSISPVVATPREVSVAGEDARGALEDGDVLLGDTAGRNDSDGTKGFL